MNRRRFLLGTAAAFAAAKLPLPNAAPTLSGVRYSAVGLPSGLVLNETTGVLTGVVTESSAGTMHVWMTDEYGRKSEVLSCTVEIS